MSNMQLDMCASSVVDGRRIICSYDYHIAWGKALGRVGGASVKVFQNKFAQQVNYGRMSRKCTTATVCVV